MSFAKTNDVTKPFTGPTSKLEYREQELGTMEEGEV